MAREILTKGKLQTVGIKLSSKQKAQLKNDAEANGYTVSEYLRRAWYMARQHPELLSETNGEEDKFQKAMGPSRWHNSKLNP